MINSRSIIVATSQKKNFVSRPLNNAHVKSYRKKIRDIFFEPFFDKKESIQKAHFTFLRILGVGYFHLPQKENFRCYPLPYVIYSCFVLGFWYATFLVCGWIDIVNHIHDFEHLLSSMNMFTTYTISIVKIAIFMWNNQGIQDVIHTLEVKTTQFYTSRDTMETCKKLCSYLTNTFALFSMFSVSGYLISGILGDQKLMSIAVLNNATASTQSNKRVLPLSIYLPFDIGSSNVSYTIVFIYEIGAMFWCGYTILFIDMTIASVMIEIRAQLVVLQKVLSNIELLALARFAEERSNNNICETATRDIDDLLVVYKSRYERYIADRNGDCLIRRNVNLYMNICLKECIRHHIMIIRCVRKLEIVYGVGFVFHIICSLNSLCLSLCLSSMTESTGGKTFTMIFLGTAFVIQLGAQCCLPEEIKHQGLLAADNAYGCQWVTADVEFRNNLKIFLIHAYIPVELTASRIVKMSNDTFLLIVKTAYSYFAVIQRMNDLL